MNIEELNRMIDTKHKVHEKVSVIYEMGNIPAMLANEYRYKVSQYDNMYNSIETMKEMTSKKETIDNLVDQQIEVLNVRVNWELDWAKRALVEQ